MSIARSFIPYACQLIEDDDRRVVAEVLQSKFLTQGPWPSNLERAICKLTGAKYTVSLANGTAALHLAVLALQIAREREAITSANTFVATANSCLYSGLKPKFADIENKTYNLDSAAVKEQITSRTSLIIPVHFAGVPADMQAYADIATEHGLYIIEDAAHAIGTHYPNGQAVGSCYYSDMTTFSFHPVKSITAGEGGAVTTNSIDLYERLLELRSHGVCREANSEPWYYEMKSLGFNYRLSDIQAALAWSQLQKLARFKKRRFDLTLNYNKHFQKLEWLKIPNYKNEDHLCRHLYVIQVDFTRLETTRAYFMAYLESRGIGSQVHYIPVVSHPYYQKLSYSLAGLPKTRAYYESCLSLPLFPSLTNEEQLIVIDAVKAFPKNLGKNI